MIRFVLVIMLNLHLSISYLCKLKKMIKHLDNYDDEFRYNYCRSIIQKINKKARITVNSFGAENIPQENGYVMYSNHQGKYDALAILTAHEKPCRVVIKKNRGKAILMRQFLEVLGAKKISMDNLKDTVKKFNEVEQELMEKKNYLIFPEGIFYDNKNSLLEFHTGCMRFLKNVKCPIVPVTIYDTYKVFNVNSVKKVSCEVHFLTPIYYEEYKDLSKQEIAELIKSRIQAKLDERNDYYNSLK